MRTARVTGRSFSPAGIVVRRGWARPTRRTMDSLAGSRRREARRGAGSADKILDRNSNFRELWRPEGEEGEAVVGVVGYGSLLSERSALSTFESVENFRLGTGEREREEKRGEDPNPLTTDPLTTRQFVDTGVSSSMSLPFSWRGGSRSVRRWRWPR